MPLLGTTAPATPAGAHVLAAAEIVAAVVLHELAAPGAPAWGSMMPTYADPRTALAMTVPAGRPLPLPGHRAAARLRPAGAFGLRRHRRARCPAPGSTAWRRACSSCSWRSTAARRSPASASSTATRCSRPRTSSWTTTCTTARATRSSTSTSARRRWRWRPSRPWARAATFWRTSTRAATCATRCVRAVTQEMGADGRHYRDALEVARERACDILHALRAARPWARHEQLELRRIVSAADEALRS